MEIEIKKNKLEIKKIAQKYQLRLVLLYGSYAKNQARKDSDIDIAVLGKKTIAFKDLINLNNEFANLFQSNEVDVKSLHQTDPLFRYQATKDSVLLYGKSDDYHSFKAYAFRDYHDSQDLFKLRDILIRRRLAFLKV